MGEVELVMKAEAEQTSATLQKVLYVPSIVANLMSISKADEGRISINFEGGKCELSARGKVLARAAKEGSMYQVQGTSSKISVAYMASNQGRAELWHRRFGHIGYDNLEKIEQHQMVWGLDLKTADIRAAREHVCESCVMAKQHKTPFPTSDSKTTRRLELLHMDMCGPMQQSSLSGKHFLATFLDDYTKLSVVQTVARKSKVPAVIKEIISMLETRSGERLQRVRTDGGGEYVNAELQSYFRGRGITHEKTAPYSPQQNGAAERLNRTIIERTRAMLFAANLPINLWDEAAMGCRHATSVTAHQPAE
jgi:hypothetical protein